jgi:hypothetical protein
MRPEQNIQSTTNNDSKYVNISFTYYVDHSTQICLWYVIIHHNLEEKRKKGRQKINLIFLMSFPSLIHSWSLALLEKLPTV